jgi:hypothetical protein
MTNDTDTKDRSGNGFDQSATTDLVTYINGPMLTNQPGALPGVTVLNCGWMPVTQHVVPRYANGVSHPAGRIVGQGPGSVIQGTLYGPNDVDIDPQVIVQTEDYENGSVKQWQSETQTPLAVLVPTFSDFTIAGRDYDGTGYAAQRISLRQDSHPEHALVCATDARCRCRCRGQRGSDL